MQGADLQSLSRRRWTTAELVAGAGITYDAFTNYLRTSLKLRGKTEGRGKARTYPLIDVYQIAMLARLSKLTGRLAWSAEALNGAIMIEAEVRSLFSDPAVRQAFGARAGAEGQADNRSQEQIEADRLAELSNSIFAAPQPYHWRDSGRPFFVFASEWNLSMDNPIIECGHKDSVGILGESDTGGVYLNMTNILMSVDRRLRDIVDGK